MRKAVVVDLDGTLLNVNTFKVYIEYVCKKALQKGRIDICIQLAGNVLLRKFRLISHETMKKRIMKRTCLFMNPRRLGLLADKLLPRLNREVLNLCMGYEEEGHFILLSTAAPESYASIISERLSLDGVCATSIPNKGKNWRENVKTVKCENTIAYLNDRHLEMDVLITDHYDDLPLLRLNKRKNILVEPNEKTIEHLVKNKISYDIL